MKCQKFYFEDPTIQLRPHNPVEKTLKKNYAVLVGFYAVSAGFYAVSKIIFLTKNQNFAA